MCGGGAGRGGCPVWCRDAGNTHRVVGGPPAGEFAAAALALAVALWMRVAERGEEEAEDDEEDED